MKHNSFDIFKDIITNLLDFFSIFVHEEKEENVIHYLETEETTEGEESVHFPLFMFSEPKYA
jgi:hypothetical protein